MILCCLRRREVLVLAWWTVWRWLSHTNPPSAGGGFYWTVPTLLATGYFFNKVFQDDGSFILSAMSDSSMQHGREFQHIVLMVIPKNAFRLLAKLANDLINLRCTSLPTTRNYANLHVYCNVLHLDVLAFLWIRVHCNVVHLKVMFQLVRVETSKVC